MLRSIQDLEGFAIRATDGEVGRVEDFYFDDQQWVIRFLVVDTGTWLSSRKVLISPIAVGRPNETDRELPVAITREQVKSGPDIDTERPVSRQQEMYHFLHYGYPQYWGDTGLGGSGMHPAMMMPEFSSTPAVIEPRLDDSLTTAMPEGDEDSHLRAFNTVTGYHIVASDGEIGHVQGMLVDENTWAIRYFIVDTGHWWSGHQVLIAPQWIQSMDWSDRIVSVHTTQQAVRDAPPYDPAVTVDRPLEEGIWKHHGHAGYWTDDPDQVRIAAPR